MTVRVISSSPQETSIEPSSKSIKLGETLVASYTIPGVAVKTINIVDIPSGYDHIKIKISHLFRSGSVAGNAVYATLNNVTFPGSYAYKVLNLTNGSTVIFTAASLLTSTETGSFGSQSNSSRPLAELLGANQTNIESTQFEMTIYDYQKEDVFKRLESSSMSNATKYFLAYGLTYFKDKVKSVQISTTGDTFSRGFLTTPTQAPPPIVSVYGIKE